jgi:hypothetical protein
MRTLRLLFGPNNSYELFIPESSIEEIKPEIAVIPQNDSRQKEFEWDELATPATAK